LSDRRLVGLSETRIIKKQRVFRVKGEKLSAIGSGKSSAGKRGG
jgi:hypothetical protein